jgi:hypothetical protein
MAQPVETQTPYTLQLIRKIRANLARGLQKLKES